MTMMATTIASLAPLIGQQQQQSHCKLAFARSSRIGGHHRWLRTSTLDARRLQCYKKEAVTVYEGEKDTWEDPNEKPDFWEGERWNLFGEILAKLYIFAILVAVGAAGYAASTYSSSSEQQAKNYAIEMAQSALEEEEEEAAAAAAAGAGVGEESSSVLPIEEE